MKSSIANQESILNHTWTYKSLKGFSDVQSVYYEASVEKQQILDGTFTQSRMTNAFSQNMVFRKKAMMVNCKDQYLFSLREAHTRVKKSDEIKVALQSLIPPSIDKHEMMAVLGL